MAERKNRSCDGKKEESEIETSGQEFLETRVVEFGERLREVRQSRGMTQQTVADHVFVTRQAVSQWESGARYPDLLTARRLADYLEVPLDQLVSNRELKEYSEHTPIMETKGRIGLQAAVYTLLAVLYLIESIFVMVSIGHIQDLISDSRTLPAAVIGSVLINGIFVLGMAGVSVYGVICSIRETLVSSLAGWMAVIFFSSRMIMTISNSFLSYSVAMYGLMLGGMFCIVPAIGIYTSVQYFLKKGKHTIAPIVIVCILYGLGNIAGLIRSAGAFLIIDRVQVFPTALSFVCSILTPSVIIWQAYVLRTKRQAVMPEADTNEREHKNWIWIVAACLLIMVIGAGFGFRYYNLNIRYRREITSFVEENQTDLEQTVQEYKNHYFDQTMHPDDFDQQYQGILILGMMETDYPLILFHYASSGMLAGSREYEFYYSFDDVPAAPIPDDYNLEPAGNDTWKWEDAEEGIQGSVSKITEHWYYCETRY